MTSGRCPIFTDVEFQRLFVFSSLRFGSIKLQASPTPTSTMKLPPPSAGDSYVTLESTSTPFSPSDRSPPVPAMMIRQGVAREISVVRSALS